MECILLGSGGMMPMPHRLLTSLAVRLNGEIYLFDAGEGTQLGLKKARLGLRGLRVIAVTHLHADHCLGLPGLLMLRTQMESAGPLTILGPPGMEELIYQIRRLTAHHLNYPLHFQEWAEGAPETAYHDDRVRILWHPVQHTCFCLGYRIEEHDRPGRFDPQRAEALGVPKGPLWGRLQRGESVTGQNGRTVNPQQVLGPSRRGRRIAFVTDTRPAKTVYRLCKEADIAFLEGMFLPEDSRHAETKGHMTVVDAARIARRAGAEKAVLVHISPRYADEDLDRLEAAAKEEFSRAGMGKDLDVYTVLHPSD